MGRELQKKDQCACDYKLHSHLLGMGGSTEVKGVNSEQARQKNRTIDYRKNSPRVTDGGRTAGGNSFAEPGKNGGGVTT